MALLHYRSTPQPMHQVARHLEHFDSFDLEIQYRKGEQHINADFMSRLPPCNRGVDGEPCVQCHRRMLGHSTEAEAGSRGRMCAIGQFVDNSQYTRYGRRTRAPARDPNFVYTYDRRFGNDPSQQVLADDYSARSPVQNKALGDFRVSQSNEKVSTAGGTINQSAITTVLDLNSSVSPTLHIGGKATSAVGDSVFGTPVALLSVPGNAREKFLLHSHAPGGRPTNGDGVDGNSDDALVGRAISGH